MLTLGKSLFLDRSGCRRDNCAVKRTAGTNGLLWVSVVMVSPTS